MPKGITIPAKDYLPQTVITCKCKNGGHYGADRKAENHPARSWAGDNEVAGGYAFKIGFCLGGGYFCTALGCYEA